ncbi:hypothetical protein BD311DRAFT_168136 [Dichomitus squalens]|uniref:Secreted protein n=1 Tax=Dichomitus squalens TaxID=114155 RepID=A0A4Q9M3I4_9APHY|nr:hypothetical protein BD311DRAFT_250948 [Dichomitus squalens]TBU22068.1 hypothetical protein BD311DRAFT_168136 [Dichomitus squalens]
MVGIAASYFVAAAAVRSCCAGVVNTDVGMRAHCLAASLERNCRRTGSRKEPATDGMLEGKDRGQRDARHGQTLVNATSESEGAVG